MDTLMIYKIIGEKIKMHRAHKVLSQEELSNMCGLSRPSIALIENGKQKLSIERLYRIAHALKVESQDLLPSFSELPSSFYSNSKNNISPFSKNMMSQHQTEEVLSILKEKS
jgi:transcriptional regulator with XRE-family HTH domain